jgi:hypothetical protein
VGIIDENSNRQGRDSGKEKVNMKRNLRVYRLLKKQLK